MSTSDAFWNQFEKFIKDEHSMTLDEFVENLTKSGDGFRDRFEKTCEILLLHSPKDNIEQERR